MQSPSPSLPKKEHLPGLRPVRLRCVGTAERRKNGNHPGQSWTPIAGQCWMHVDSTVATQATRKPATGYHHRAARRNFPKRARRKAGTAIRSVTPYASTTRENANPNGIAQRQKAISHAVTIPTAGATRKAATARTQGMPESNGEVEGPPRSARSSAAGA